MPNALTRPLNWLRLALILFLAAFAVYTAWGYLQIQISSWNPRNLTDDPVSNWEARCEELKQALPRSGEIGYLANWDLPGWQATSNNQSDMDNEFRLTQYALTPRVLVRGAAADYIVGNLTSDQAVGQVEKLFKVKMVHSYGLGIYLFKKAAP
jgi:hypothetical protein